ncbi:MAG: hypothetical protein ACFFF4_10820 [Candidatus Thorarchaeota archaeon]
MTTKEDLIEILREEMNRQRAIFNKHAGRAINPDNSPEYAAAKEAFDAADRKIKSLDKEIARLLTEEEAYDPTIWDKIGDYWKKLTGDDDLPDSVATGVRG